MDADKRFLSWLNSWRGRMGKDPMTLQRFNELNKSPEQGWREFIDYWMEKDPETTKRVLLEMNRG